ncbi:MAG: aminotransferase class V-fold PLP-dependent enzyme [Thermoplasmata archaeon]|uniref:Aminotransferase class V-fold PLP-dependent enzyme n=1 Tax=Candidatus Sysuiplasma superficiale TaxID=2823368 RepID=A0A8J8CBH1_9ARCH|nr:aminotransferase class V-fold PLP-dependent enzyme [Candidatus Sysuiplasma superficiale]MBX8644786.1 aminotransferase class V-fold PLP-dependent enzyme [Candidatus Sysuiplasma superficiale]
MLDRLGVRRIVNASGTLTKLGGCRVSPNALQAMQEIAGEFVDMNELTEKAGSYVAKLAGAEDAMITSGAAAGIVLSVAASMTGDDTEKMVSLPQTSGMRNEVLMQSVHFKDNPYSSLVTIPGAMLKVIGNGTGDIRNDIECAITERTCAILHAVFQPDDSLPLSEVVRIAHLRGIKVIVDAAAELPPVENIANIIDSCADAVVFSGGKDISAPNDTGVIFGKKEVIMNCRKLGPISYLEVDGRVRTFIGRPMKTSKEDIVAFVAAFEDYLKLDHYERIRGWYDICSRLRDILADGRNDRIRTELIIPGKGERIRPVIVPRLRISISGVEPEQICESLKRNDPPIYAICRSEGIYINPQCLREEDLEIVVNALLSVASKH